MLAFAHVLTRNVARKAMDLLELWSFSLPSTLKQHQDTISPQQASQMLELELELDRVGVGVKSINCFSNQ